MSTKKQILDHFNKGKLPKDLEGQFSKKTIYKYWRCYLLIRILAEYNRILYTDGWEFLDANRLKQILAEGEKW